MVRKEKTTEPPASPRRLVASPQRRSPPAPASPDKWEVLPEPPASPRRLPAYGDVDEQAQLERDMMNMALASGIPLAELDARLFPPAPASPRHLSEFPHGWKHSGNVTAFAIDRSRVTSTTLDKVVEATHHHLGGRKAKTTTTTKDGKASYIEATVETNLCGNLTMSLTSILSKTDAFKDLGCRVYFRGPPRRQQDLDEIREWMNAIVNIVSVD